MKNSFKRFMLFASMFTASFCLMALPASAAKSTKPAMKSRLTINAGSMKRLRVTNPGQKVKWSVENEDLVSIKKTDHDSIILKGEKRGTTMVWAKMGETTLKCRVTIKKVKFRKQVPAVEIETTVHQKNGAHISWNKIKGADGYEIYSGTKNNKKLVTKCRKNVTSYYDKEVSVLSLGNYYVRAYKKKKDGTMVYSAFNKRSSVVLEEDD